MADTQPELRSYAADELASLTPEQHFRLQHELTYRPGLDTDAYPDTTVLPVGTHSPARWTHHPVAEVDGQWATATGHAEKGVYRTLAAMTGLKPGGKGTITQVAAVPGLVFDLDTLDGFHEPAKSGLPDPTREQAQTILARFAEHGIRCTFVLDTGGGYQAVVICDQPLDPTSPVFATAAKALKAVCAELGVSHDPKVTRNPAALMRVAGTRNRKTKPAELTDTMVEAGWTRERLDAVRDDLHDAPVRLVEVTAETMTRADLERALNGLLATHAPKSKSKAAQPPPSVVPPAPATPTKSVYRHACGGTDDPRDQVCVALPMSRIVRCLDRFAAIEDRESLVELENSGGEESRYLTWADNPDRTTSAEVLFREHPDTGVLHSTVVAYGNATSELFGSAESAPQCTFWYVRNAHCDGDADLTSAWIRHFTSEAGDPDAEGLLSGLNACQSADQVREAFPGLEDQPDTAQENSGPISLAEQLAEALENFSPTQARRIEIARDGDRTLFVVLGGGDAHGTWSSVPKWDSEAGDWVDKETQLWGAVAYREDSVSYLDGDVEVTESLARAVILDRHGRRFSTGLTPFSDAVSAAEAWTLARPEGVLKPSSAIAGDISTCLMSLSLEGETRIYQTAMGWHQDPDTDRWQYNGTTAGVSAAGSIPGIWRKPPEVERTGRAVNVHPAYVSACQEATGWPHVPATAEEIAVAASVIGALRDLTPNRLDIHLSLLGSYAAAPLLGLAETPAVNLEGEPESGKSKLVSCYHTLLTSLPIGARNLTASLAVKFSVPGIDGLRRSYNDAVVVLDDAALNNDVKKNADVLAVVDGAVKAAFGSADGPMADGSGGTRVRRSSRCAVIVTSEKPLEGLGIESRALALPRMAKGDLHVDVDGQFGGVVHDGLPRWLYAAYIRWLAASLDEHGPAALRERIYAHKSRLYQRLGKVRAVDVAGSVYAGLMMLGEFLDAYGCREAMASEAEIDVVMESLTAESKHRHAEAGIGQVAVDHLAGLLDSGRAFLEGSAQLSDPEADAVPGGGGRLAVACGWRNMDGQWKTRPNAVPLGYITDEDESGQRYVLITDAGLQAAWRLADRAERHTQVRSAWRSGLTVGKFSGVKRPSIGLPGPPKPGSVFRPETLGIAVTSFDDQARALSAGTMPPGPADVVPPAEPQAPERPSPSPSSAGGTTETPAGAENPRGESVSSQVKATATDSTTPERRNVTAPAPTSNPETDTSAQAGETAEAAGTPADTAESALFPSPEPLKKQSAGKKQSEPKPLTRKQVEKLARQVPRILPTDMIHIDIG